ncbi:MAG: response regulator [bacterium]
MKRRLLIVDDEAYFREAVASYLEDEGYEVRVAATAGEALERVAAEVPDLCVLDLRMPDVDGFELASRLRRVAPELRLLVVSGSARFLPAAALESLGLDAEDVVAKPIPRLATLADRIAERLGDRA